MLFQKPVHDFLSFVLDPIIFHYVNINSSLWQQMTIHLRVNYLFKNHTWPYTNPPLDGAKRLDYSKTDLKENAYRCLLSSCQNAKGDSPLSAPHMLLVTTHNKRKITYFIWQKEKVYLSSKSCSVTIWTQIWFCLNILHTKALYRKALVYFMNHVALWNIEEEESNCTHRSNFHKPRSSESAWKQWEEERVRVITGQTAQEQRSWF